MKNTEMLCGRFSLQTPQLFHINSWTGQKTLSTNVEKSTQQIDVTEGWGLGAGLSVSIRRGIARVERFPRLGWTVQFVISSFHVLLRRIFFLLLLLFWSFWGGGRRGGGSWKVAGWLCCRRTIYPPQRWPARRTAPGDGLKNRMTSQTGWSSWSLWPWLAGQSKEQELFLFLNYFLIPCF